MVTLLELYNLYWFSVKFRLLPRQWKQLYRKLWLNKTAENVSVGSGGVVQGFTLSVFSIINNDYYYYFWNIIYLRQKKIGTLTKYLDYILFILSWYKIYTSVFDEFWTQFLWIAKVHCTQHSVHCIQAMYSIWIHHWTICYTVLIISVYFLGDRNKLSIQEINVMISRVGSVYRVTDCGVGALLFKSRVRILLLEQKPVLYHEWSGVVETHALYR